MIVAVGTTIQALRPHRLAWGTLVGLGLAVLAHPALAQVDPPGEPTASALALVADLEHLVAVQEQRGWDIDRPELEALLPDALPSLCRVQKPARELARELMARRVTILGGRAGLRDAVARAGGDVDAVAEGLQIERTDALLRLSLDHAGECPYWLRPHAVFQGRQNLHGRHALRVDGGGLAMVQHGGGRWTYGGGGSGRLLLGAGLSRQVSLWTGPEGGGHALIDQGGAKLRLQVQFGWPVLVRLTRRQWHVDMDLSPVAQVTQDAVLSGVGGRVGLLVAVSSLRILETLPWAGIGVAYEILPWGTSPGTQTVRAGLRVGFDWDYGAKARDRQAWTTDPHVD